MTRTTYLLVALLVGCGPSAAETSPDRATSTVRPGPTSEGSTNAPTTTSADSDMDGVVSVDDLCPSDPEDRDGFEDVDGCPDPDNDADGVADMNDGCPNDPETVNGLVDDDGCPDATGSS